MAFNKKLEKGLILCYNGHITSVKRRIAVNIDALLAEQPSNWIIDVGVILFALIMTAIFAKKGFINCFFGAI